MKAARKRVVGYGQVPCRGGQPWPGHLQRWPGPATAKALCRGKQPARGSRPQAWLALAGAAPTGVDRGRRPRPSSKGRLPATRPHGAVLQPGLPPTRTILPL
ncbi:hypothetical protein GW17_00020687 [Ensete ventricosum]|nr:hypothetical protein GW17_00020687 [Ensete ventricosum]RZR96901.1 hypothetical protein BHM03_00025981 [Ensete ventricosum]